MGMGALDRITENLDHLPDGTIRSILKNLVDELKKKTATLAL